MITLEVKCFATLAKLAPEGGTYEAEDGLTVGGLMERLSIPAGEVKIRFVNSVHVGEDHVLKDGDRVGLFPAIGGG